ncbi:hypothetical protein BH24ACT26_BH24ACT26_10830 [soil metagenome]|jgi:uncharacterized protein (DUF983 family)
MGTNGHAGLTTLVVRALRRRCPVCGVGTPFTGWFRMTETCPHCGYRFEREDGYWVSAMIVNTAVTEVLFGIIFVAVLIATIPDVDWAPLLIVGLVTNTLVPVFFYPLSKTVWVALNIYFHPLELSERPTRAG